MKKNIILTGSSGNIGKFLKNKLKKNFNIINLEKNFNYDESNIQKLFKKKIYAVIFAHGKNTTPFKNIKNNKELFNEKDVQNYLDINFFINLKLIKNYVTYNNSGKIINFSSIYSIKSPKHFIYKNFSKDIGYSCSKAASNILTKYLGTMLGANFCFNNIILGGVNQKGLDPFFVKNYKLNSPKKRMMKLEEILPVINFLLDKNNTYTNAQDIYVDGGWLSW